MKTIIKMRVTASVMMILAGFAMAEDSKPLVDAGTLYVHGQLQENTCRLTMDSAWQDVDMGSTARADVNVVGKTALPITVKLYLHDCPELANWSTNITPMTTTISSIQPPYKARILGVSDEYNPELIKVVGASGIGLRLRNNQGKSVMLSRTGDAMLLNPGQDQVTFTIQAERTAATFIPGPYHAVIYFSMIYQ